MKYIAIDPKTLTLQIRDDLSRAVLLAWVNDDELDQTAIRNDIAVVVGEESLLRAGHPFLEIRPLDPGISAEIVRGPVAIVRISADGSLEDLETPEETAENVLSEIEKSLKRWRPIKSENGIIQLTIDNGLETISHHIVKYSIFDNSDFAVG